MEAQKHMMKFKSAILAAGAFLAFSASAAFADTITYTITSPLITGNSWASAASLNTFSLGIPNGNVVYNKAVFTHISGSTFEVGIAGSVQGLSKVFQGGTGTGGNQFTANAGTWTEGAGSTSTSATTNNGSTATQLGYVLWLNGAGATGDTSFYKVDFFNGSTQVALGFVRSTVTSENQVDTVVQITNNIPVPPAVWTGVAMLGGMMLLVRRRNRRVLA